MKYFPLEMNLLLIVLLSIALLFIFILSVKIKHLKNEQNRILNENKEDSKVLFLKSRYASMGETVGNIAHQWKQPLNAIGAIQNSIKAALIFQGEISKEKLLNSVDTSFKLIQHLAETIDTFYSFLAQRSDNNMSFFVADELEKIRKITEYSFNNSNIQLKFLLDSNPAIQGNANEFTHAMLNLVLNAKDALDETKNDSPTITIKVEEGDETCTIRVFDNGGGIRIDPIDIVFDLHITTKEEGSGLGLYMTKNIIENRFGGSITVENKQGGACFSIKLPYAEYDENFSLDEASDKKLTLERIRQLTHKVIELEELEKTLQKWAEIFEQAQWGIVIGNIQEQSFEVMNPIFATMHGFSVEELTGKKIESVFAPECRAQLKFVIETAHREGYCAFESIHIRKDGSRFPVAIELMAIKDKSGTVLYRVANVWDITERKAAEERLKLKKFALNHIKDAVFMIDENANFHYANEGACKALGYTREEFEQMNVGDIDPDWPQKKWRNHWNELKALGPMTMELYHRRKDGTVFPVEVSANYIEFGNKHYNMAIARDITERKLLEVQKDNERMRLFFERQLVGMAITSPQKGWIHTNEKLQQMLGYTHEELTQLTWLEMTHPDDLAPDVEQFEKLLRAEIEDYMLEKRFIRKDGTIVYTNLAVSCVRNDNRSVNYVLALLEDITERKRIEEKIRFLNTTLEKRVIERTAQLQEVVTTLHNEITERKEAEKKLKMVDSAVNSSSEAIYINDMHLSILYVNDGACRMLGYTREELMEMKIYDIDALFSKEKIFELRDGTIDIKQSFFETKHKTKDGRIIDVEIVSNPFIHEGVEAVISVVKDIMEKKAVHKLLQLVETAMNYANEAVYIIGDDRSILYVSDVACRMLGYSREEFMSMKVYEIDAGMSKDDIDAVQEKVSSTNVIMFETKHRTKDGCVLDVEITVTPFSYDDVNLRLSIVKDITERKKLEEKMYFREQYQRTLLDNFPYFVWLKDQESHLLAANLQYARVAKVKSTADLEGKTDFDFFPRELAEKYVADDQAVMREATPKNVEEQYADEHGEIHWMETWKSPVWVNGSIVGTVGCSRDITNQKKAEAMIKESEQRYKEIFENTSDSIYLMEVTEDGRFQNITANPAFIRSIGIPLEVLEGSYVGDLTDEKDTATVIEKYRRCIEAGVPTEEIAQLDLPVGRRTFCSTLIPIKDESGRVCRIIGLAKDITESKK